MIAFGSCVLSVCIHQLASCDRALRYELQGILPYQTITMDSRAVHTSSCLRFVLRKTTPADYCIQGLRLFDV